MKIPRTNTLTFQIGIVLAILFSLLTLLIVMTVKRSFEEKKFADEYIIKNEIIGNLNAATAWQAIERGCGATILGSGEGGSSPLFSTFLDMIERGDADVLQVEEQIKRLLRVVGNETLERQLDKWRKGYEDLIRIRPKIAINNISKDEWLSTATRNINNGFDIRNIAFAPQKIDEKLLYLNNDLRTNISRLCEYAGLERAIVGNIIASGKPFSQESSNEIGHYRSIVEQSLNQLLILKDYQTTSTRMKQAIENFEKEFLQSFNIIREEVFTSSREQQEEIRVSSDQITKRKVIFRNCLSEISNGLLNMSNQNSIKMLAKALNGLEDTDHSEQLHMVENLFETFSQLKKNFFQIRYLDIAGYERVRVDFDGKVTKTVSDVQLQDRSFNSYFQKIRDLQPGEIYISPLELNREYGKIEIPHKPIIHFATPVFVDKKRSGFLIFNVFANTPFFLHKVVENEGKGDHILANQNGLYLHHPYGVKERNETHHSVRQDYPDVAEQILSGKKGRVRLASGKMVVYEPFFLKIDNNLSGAGNGDNFWVIIKEVNAVEYPVDTLTWFERATKAINTGLAISNIAGEEANAVLLEINSAAKRNIVISFLAFVAGISFFVFFILWSRNRILGPIKRLTGITKRISEGDYAFTFEVKRRDEIGLLAKNFNKMAGELTKMNEDWELTFDAVEDIITLHDRDSRLIRFNNSLIASFNIKPEYIDDLKCYDFNHNKNGFLLMDRIKELSKNKQSTTIEIEEPSIGRVFNISSYPRYDNTGIFIGTVQITRDITERKCIEKNLKREKEFIDIFVNNAQDAIICIDVKGIIKVWNKMAEKVFGYPESEIIGQPITTIIPERYKHRHKHGIERLLRTGEYKIIGKTVEVFGKTKAGIEIPIAMSLSAQQDVDEGYVFSAIIRDMTENHKREDEIRKLLRAIEQSPASVVITDTKGDIEYVNKKFTRVTGYTSEEAIGQNPRVLKSDDKTSEEYKELWETITSGNEWRGEFSNKNKEGKIYWESASISPIKNSNGDITHFIAVKEDISAQKQMEKVQKRSHFRIREINSFCTEISHRSSSLDPYARLFAFQMKRNLKKTLKQDSLHEFRHTDTVVSYFIVNV
ncbi:MAG: PAS domain S-box protein [Candidatus Scalindua sp.]|nr:MAG: PAS domain S-box protein [Candidatus Scalindua sp.]